VEYDQSSRALCAALGLELREVPDWSCCGASPAHGRGKELQAAMAARNVELARAAGLEELVTPCPSCLAALKTAEAYAASETGRERLSALCGLDVQPGLPARSLLEVVHARVGIEGIAGRTAHPLAGLRAATYYGCLLTRPAELMAFDDAENPVAMDELLLAAGAEVVDFPFKTECCGASFGVPKRELVTHLSGRIVAMAERCGANAIVVACPLCHQNLDLRRSQLGPEGKGAALPVLYFTQALGLALGLEPRALGLNRHAVSTDALVRDVLAGRTAAGESSAAAHGRSS
jgi:heterodisulfide reductase subunit B